MSANTRNRCLAASLAIAALAAGSAQAAKPMNVLEKKAAAEAMALAYQQRAATRQVARKTAPTTLAAPGGGTGTEVPDDLHNYLHAQVDAQGNVRIVETDGPAAPAKQEANHE